MKKIICLLLVAVMTLFSFSACSKEKIEKHTVNIYRSTINSRGVASTSKIKTITVEDGDIVGQIEKGYSSYLHEFKGFFTEKTAVQGQEWNPLKDEVHSDLDIYAVWEYKK